MTERFIASKARLVSRQHGEWRVQYGQIRRAALLQADARGGDGELREVMAAGD
jgi:hypothetical protein